MPSCAIKLENISNKNDFFWIIKFQSLGPSNFRGDPPFIALVFELEKSRLYMDELAIKYNLYADNNLKKIV